jgi:hypothetical protein
MPNWCTNQFTIQHEDPEQIKKVKKAMEEGNLFNTFVPEPELEGNAWFTWRVNNWGTKWEVSDYFGTAETPNSISAGFVSAWAPPTPIYDAMVAEGFKVQAYYYEPGESFGGIYNDGVDDYIEPIIPGNIPEELDEMFNISGWLEEAEA